MLFSSKNSNNTFFKGEMGGRN